MGYLERLKQEEELARQSLHESSEVFDRRMKKWQENALNAKRLREQAEAYLDRTDFPKILEEFKGLMEHRTILSIRDLGKRTSVRITRATFDPSTLPKTLKAISPIDINASIHVAWGEYRHEKQLGSGRARIEEGNNYIVIQCSSNGEVSIVAKEKRDLFLNEWLGHSDIQRGVLDIAFENPAKFATFRISRPYSEENSDHPSG